MTTTTQLTTPTSACIAINNKRENQRQSWSCYCCRLFFDTGVAQRDHMKSHWHVYNLKRRITSLPPISQLVYDRQIESPLEPTKIKETHTHVERIPIDMSLEYQCLFCASTFENTIEGLEENASHMLIEHGLFIPNLTNLWDIGSFLSYLATQVQVWHECLYCGTTKATTQSVQDHMRDSGHCMLNFEKEPELVEFWECRSKAAEKCAKSISYHTTTGTRKAKRLPGKMVMSSELCSPVDWRLQEPQTQQSSRVKQKPAISSSETQHRENRQVCSREKFGVQNISPEQRHALVFAFKRSQKDEAIARRAKEWSYARRANDQKHDQAYGALSWAKGGMHNLLPR